LVGNYFSLFSVEEPDGWTTHFGFEGAGFFGMRQNKKRFPLETIDGLIGLYLEGKQDKWQVQFRYTHVSAHLADGADSEAIAYSRETLVTRVGYLITPDIHLYGGMHLVTHAIPEVPVLGLQWGTTAFLPWRWMKFVPFAAADFKWSEESKYNPSFALQLGIAANNPPTPYHSFRFFYRYYTGSDPRGQYYLGTFTSHSFGIEMQI